MEGKCHRGQSLKWSADNVMACHLRDKRDAYILCSNRSGNDTLKPVSKYRQNELIYVPELVLDYNKKMAILANLGATVMLDAQEGNIGSMCFGG